MQPQAPQRLSRDPLAAAVSLACTCASTLLLSGALYAQQAQEAGSELEEVTVTGTRIERATGFTSPVPVTAVTDSELTEFQPGGTITEQLDTLPQFFDTETAQRGSGALFGGAGISTLNMRGMGNQRTLVLIDGVRTVPADRNSRVNTDNIPSALIEQVDVVTGGASAAYGADALAGVTNFVLDRDFEGFEVDFRTGQTEVGDGQHRDVAVAGGTAFGPENRWHVTFGAEAQEIEQIYRSAADEELGDWFQRYGFVQNPEWTGPGDTEHAQRIIRPNVHSTLHTPGGLINEPGFSYNRQTFLEDGERTREYTLGDVGCFGLAGEACTINSTSGGPEFLNSDAAFDDGSIEGNEVKRHNLFLGLEYDISDRTQVFGHLLSGETQSNQHGRRGDPHLMGVWHARIFRENPFLPDHIREAMHEEGVESIRLDKLGQIRGPGLRNWADNERQKNVFDTWSLALGFDHDLFDGENWHLRGQIQRGETDKSTNVFNINRVDRMFLAIDAVSVDPTTGELLGDEPGEDPARGEIMCNVQRVGPTREQLEASVADVRVPAPIGDDSLGGPDDFVPIPGPVAFDNTIRDCVPLNILGHGNVSREAQAYLSDHKEGVGAVTQTFAELLVTGDISDGIGAGSFAMATGATYREETFWQRSLPRELMAFGPPTNAPELGIRGISPGWAGNRNVHEFSDVPAIQGQFDVWEMFAELDLPLLNTEAGRTLATNLAWRRSDYSLSGPITSAKLGIDFGITESLRLRTTLSRDVREPTFSERFDFQGGGGNIFDPVFDGQQFQTTSIDGGNPNLNPEEADTFTAGIVYQPSVAPGLQVSLDYYEIDLTNAVDQLGLQAIVDQCYETGALCDQVHRDPNTNVVTLIENVFLNVADAYVSGYDLEVLWNTDVDFFGDVSESLSMRMLAGVQTENSQTPAGGRKIERSGGMAFPEFKGFASVNYEAGPFRFRLQQRYIEERLLDTEWVEGVDIDDNTVESQSITNMTFGYGRDLPGGGLWEASLVINNVLDVDPPVIASFGDRGGAQDINNNYDVFGRRYSLSFNYGF